MGAINGCTDEIRTLKETGKQRDFKDFIQTFAELNNFLGLQYYSSLEQRYKGNN
jgi:2-methylisocitrate lyase-like PEP mutase family enzyme